MVSITFNGAMASAGISGSATAKRVTMAPTRAVIVSLLFCLAALANVCNCC